MTGDIADYTEAGMPDHDVCRATFEGLLGLRRRPRPRSPGLVTVLRPACSTTRSRPSELPRCCPACPPALASLAGRTGSCSGSRAGNVEAAAHIKLARGGLNRWFTFGWYGSDPASTAVSCTRIAITEGRRRRWVAR